eukprot:scaffold72369_cov54-Phaeocystis_antarctica.AAC.1
MASRYLVITPIAAKGARPQPSPDPNRDLTLTLTLTLALTLTLTRYGVNTVAFAPFEDGVVEFGTTAASATQWDAMPQVRARARAR